MNPQWSWVPSIGQNVKFFTGNGDVSKWVENSRVDRKTLYKQSTFKDDENGDDLLIDYIVFYAVSAIFRPYNGGNGNEEYRYG